MKDTDTVVLELTGKQIRALIGCIQTSDTERELWWLMRHLESLTSRYSPEMANSVHSLGVN